nr:replication initiation protein [Lewinella sp. JB7]
MLANATTSCFDGVVVCFTLEAPIQTLLKSNTSLILQQDRFLLGMQTISLRARQLVYVLAMCLDKDDPTGIITIDSKEFQNWINTNGKRKWSNIHGLVASVFDELNKNPVYLRRKPSASKTYNKKDFIKVNWVQKCGVVGGKIIAQFTEDAAQYFMYKQGLPYTRTLWDLRGYKSQYASRTVDLFQREHRNSGGENEFKFNFPLLDLKIFYGVPDRYPRVTDFCTRVLKQAQTELEEDITAPYYFTYNVDKRGRRVVGIDFDVTVRPDELIRLAPEIEFLTAGSNEFQRSLFDGTLELSEEKQRLIGAVAKVGKVAEKHAVNMVYNLSESQGRALVIMMKYGVNHSLAYKLVKNECSFGELEGYEDYYVKHSLQLLEEARLKRIEEAKTAAVKKKTTPKDKRGGLAKGVFVKRLHFASFMESLSAVRKKEFEDSYVGRKEKLDGGFKDVGEVLRQAKANLKG